MLCAPSICLFVCYFPVFGLNTEMEGTYPCCCHKALFWHKNSITVMYSFQYSSKKTSLFLKVFYLSLRDRVLVGRGRERETQTLRQAPGSELSAQSPTRGSNPQTMRSWPEVKLDTQPTEPPRHPMNWTVNYFDIKDIIGATGNTLMGTEGLDGHEVSMSIFFLMLIYFWERDGNTASGEGAEREGDRIPSRLPGSELSAQSPTRGSNPQTVRSWPKPKSDA